MMHIRPIQPHELAAFAAAGDQPEHTDSVHEYLDQMLAKGAMRVEWCFVAEEAGRLLGRVACWTLPSIGTPLALVLLDAPWQGDYLGVGTGLLEHSVGVVRGLGGGKIEHVLDAPPQWPQWQHFPDQRQHLLTQFGFAIERETRRFEWQAGDAQPSATARLTFRPLLEVGEEAFVQAIERVSASSFDQRTQSDRAQLGPQQEARNTFADLQGMEYDPAWWQLAFSSDGELAGLVMPTRAPAAATIGYIGIVPEQRGRGYIDDLLAQGTATLRAAGATAIRADTDVANFPMANAFLRAGYREFATRREYALNPG
jgi:RimJ/RimL family protein N-acetyltransferase